MTQEEILRARLKALNDYLATCASKEIADFYIDAMKDLHAYRILPDKVHDPK